MVLKIYLSVQTSCHQSFMMSMLNCKELRSTLKVVHGMFLEHLLQKKNNFQIGYAQLVKRIFMSLSQFNVTLV